MYYLVEKKFMTNLKLVKSVFKVIKESEVSFNDKVHLRLYNNYEYDSKKDKIKQFAINSKSKLYRKEIKEAVNIYIIKKRIKKLNKI